jgi:hypothetical protein
MQFNNVFVVQDVVSLDILAVINAGTPDFCGFYFFSQLAVHFFLVVSHSGSYNKKYN